MAICEFCGKEIPEGGLCDCGGAASETAEEAYEEAVAEAEEDAYEETLAEVEAEAESVIPEEEELDDDDSTIEDIVSEDEEEESVPANAVNSIDFLSSAPEYTEETEENGETQAYDEKTAEEAPAESEEPVRKAQPVSRPKPVRKPMSPQARRRAKRRRIARRRRCAALVILILFFMGTSFIRNHTGCRGAVNQYWKCVVDEDGGEDYYTMALPNAVIRHFEDTGEWDSLIDNYENLSSKAVKLKRVRRKKRMTKEELRSAEKYLYGLAKLYGAEAADGEIIADKGYFVTVVYKFGEDKVLGGAYYVKVEGDGWKVLPHDMDK